MQNHPVHDAESQAHGHVSKRSRDQKYRRRSDHHDQENVDGDTRMIMKNACRNFNFSEKKALKHNFFVRSERVVHDGLTSLHYNLAGIEPKLLYTNMLFDLEIVRWKTVSVRVNNGEILEIYRVVLRKWRENGRKWSIMVENGRK